MDHNSNEQNSDDDVTLDDWESILNEFDPSKPDHKGSSTPNDATGSEHDPKSIHPGSQNQNTSSADTESQDGSSGTGESEKTHAPESNGDEGREYLPKRTGELISPELADTAPDSNTIDVDFVELKNDQLNLGVDYASLKTRNLHDFGPFDTFAEKVSQTLMSLDEDNPAMHPFANEYIMYVRQSLHDALLINPEAFEGTESGINCRENVLVYLQEQMEHFTTSQLPNGITYVDGIKKYEIAIRSLMESENRKLRILSSSFREPTPFEALMNKASNSLFGQKNTKEYSQKLKISRENTINDRLNRLDEIATEMRKNCGNQAWEEGIGKARAAEATAHYNDVKDVMSKVMNQTNEKGFLKRFDAINKKIDDVKANAVSDDFKKSLSGLMEKMNDLFKKILQSIGLRGPSTATSPSNHRAPSM